MKNYLFVTALALMSILSSCHKKQEIISYHKFKDQTWNRFEKLTFDIPLQEAGKIYDVYFFAAHTMKYEFDNLNFNMVMTAPGGEERIKEYTFLIKRKTGEFTGRCDGDSCTAQVALKKGLEIGKKGMLRVEIEALVPRVEITSLKGVGIRLVATGQ